MRLREKSLSQAVIFFFALSVCIFSASEEFGWISALMAALLAGYFVLHIAKTRAVGPILRYFCLYLLFVGWAAASLLWSVEPQVGRAITLAQVVGVSVICLAMLSKSGESRPIEFALYLGLVVSLFGGVGDHSAVDAYEREGGSFGHANALATGILGAVLFAARRGVMALNVKGRPAGLFLFFVVLALSTYLTFFESGSRRAVLIICLCLAYVIWRWMSSNQSLVRKAIAIASMATLLLLAIPVILESDFYFRIESLMSFLGGGQAIREKSVFVRSYMIDEAIRQWQSAPFVGNGIDNFRVVSNFGTYSHDNYLELLSGLGLVGCLLFYLPICLALVQSLKMARVSMAKEVKEEALWIAAGIGVILISDLFFVSYYDKFNWLLVVALLSRLTWLRQARFLAERSA